MIGFNVLPHSIRFFILVLLLSFMAGSNVALAQNGRQDQNTCKQAIANKYTGSSTSTNQYGVVTTTNSRLLTLDLSSRFSPGEQDTVSHVFGQFGANWVYFFNMLLETSRSAPTHYQVFCIVDPNQTRILGIEHKLAR